MINERILSDFVNSKTTFQLGFSPISLKSTADDRNALQILRFLKDNSVLNEKNKRYTERFFCLLLWLTWKYPIFCQGYQKDLHNLFQSVYIHIPNLNATTYRLTSGIKNTVDEFIKEGKASSNNLFSNGATMLQVWGRTFLPTDSNSSYIDLKKLFEAKSVISVEQEKITAYLFGALQEITEEPALTTEASTLITKEPALTFNDILSVWKGLKYANTCLQQFTALRFIRLSLSIDAENFIIWLNEGKNKDDFNFLASYFSEGSLVDLKDIEEIRLLEQVSQLPKDNPFYKALHHPVTRLSPASSSALEAVTNVIDEGVDAANDVLENFRNKIISFLPNSSVDSERPDQVLQVANENLTNRLTSLVESLDLSQLPGLTQTLEELKASNLLVPSSTLAPQAQTLQTAKNSAWNQFSNESFATLDDFNQKLKTFYRETARLEITHYNQEVSSCLTALKKTACLEDSHVSINDTSSLFTVIANKFSQQVSFESLKELNEKLSSVKDDLKKLFEQDLTLEQFFKELNEIESTETTVYPKEIHNLFAHFESEILRYSPKKDENGNEVKQDHHNEKRVAQLKLIKKDCLHQVGLYYASSTVEQNNNPLQRRLAKILENYSKNPNVFQCKPGTVKSMLFCCFNSTTANRLNDQKVKLTSSLTPKGITLRN